MPFAAWLCNSLNQRKKMELTTNEKRLLEICLLTEQMNLLKELKRLPPEDKLRESVNQDIENIKSLKIKLKIRQ